MNGTDAYLIRGEQNYEAVVREFAVAVLEAAKHHGCYYELVRADAVVEMLHAADAQGYKHGYDQGRKDEHDASLRG